MGNMNNWFDFDITFCHGTDAKGTACPKRDTCHRYWSEMTSKQAEKLGMRYSSFFLIDDVDKCNSYWEEK